MINENSHPMCDNKDDSIQEIWNLIDMNQNTGTQEERVAGYEDLVGKRSLSMIANPERAWMEDQLKMRRHQLLVRMAVLEEEYKRTRTELRAVERRHSDRIGSIVLGLCLGMTKAGRRDLSRFKMSSSTMKKS